MELQELVTRARIIFKGAPKRVKVFELVNGKRSAKEIAIKSSRSLSSILQDLQKMKDMGLLVYRLNPSGEKIRKDDSIIYDKDPILKHLSSAYFREPEKLPKKEKDKTFKKRKNSTSLSSIKIPSETEILEICKSGEDQSYEFKRAGVDIREVSKEICALANTKNGGIIFYGVEDDGSINNADMKKQNFDQRIHNSVRNTVAPSIFIRIIEKDVLGHKIFLIIIPGWNRKAVYQYEGRIYIRQGTNVFVAKPEEVRQLHNGKYIV